MTASIFTKVWAIRASAAKAMQRAGLKDASIKICEGGFCIRANFEAAPALIVSPPDFSAATHKPHRKKLAALIELVAARDIEALRAFPIKPYSTSPKAMMRFRDRAIEALAA